MSTTTTAPRTTTANYRVNPDKASKAKRPVRTCLTCTNRTMAKSGVCRDCATATRVAIETPAYDLALTGGRWVQDGLTQRWEPSGRVA